MGATLKSKSGRTLLRNLRTRFDRMKQATTGVKVVAGFIAGKSTPDSIFKAYVSEFGSMTTGAISSDREQSIPSRPFMYQSLPQMKQNISAALQGITTRNIKAKLDTVGDVMAIAIDESLNSGDFVPNTAYTIEKKGSSQPLVDTGEMRDNIRSEVQKA